MWAWHPSGNIKGTGLSPSWVTDATDTNYQRDCKTTPATGNSPTSPFVTSPSTVWVPSEHR